MKRRRDMGWMKDMVAVVIFLLLFPYFTISFKQQKNQLTDEPCPEADLQTEYDLIAKLPHNQKYFVVWEEEGTRLTLPVEHFLVGALAASIPLSYEEEVLKAQAVILRSDLCRRYEEIGKNKQGIKTITIGTGEGNYWTDYRMQSAWGKSYEEYLKKCTDAVVNTQGIYLAYEGKAIAGYYHGMSAGRTRDGTELSGEGRFGYLRSTDCTDNLSSQSYVTETKIRTEEVGKLEEDRRTADGYVISVQREEQSVPGEQLREELGLASSNFSWVKDNDYYIFTVKGFGHGFGLDQYYGNVLASKSKDYKEIIDYFFADVTFQKME
nr:hypothetical protein [Lachnospiraceae bacterium]